MPSDGYQRNHLAGVSARTVFATKSVDAADQLTGTLSGGLGHSEERLCLQEWLHESRKAPGAWSPSQQRPTLSASVIFFSVKELLWVCYRSSMLGVFSVPAMTQEICVWERVYGNLP